jgi:hypothetical protein
MRGIHKREFDKLVPVQIIGTQRSGSNLLRLMLNQLHGVFAPHPPHILKTFMPILNYFGDLNKPENYRELVEDICEFVRINPVPWLNSQLDPEMIIAHSNTPTFLEAYRKIHEVNAMANQARIWFNKSMQNVYYIAYFEENQFNPYYIHLVRDGRDVALSFKKTIVGHKHIYNLATQWRQDQELSNFYLNRYAPDRAIRVKYEDLLHQPEYEIRRICAFIGLEYSNNVLKFYESPDSRITAESGEMWHNLSKPLMKDNFNKYKRELSPDEVLIFEKVAGDLLISYGYALENPSTDHMNMFSADEIREFDAIDKQLKKEAIRNSTEIDLLKRYEQEQFLIRLHRQKGIVMPS